LRHDESFGRPYLTGELLEGGKLTAAQEWMDQHEAGFTERERTFVAHSATAGAEQPAPRPRDACSVPLPPCMESASGLAESALVLPGDSDSAPAAPLRRPNHEKQACDQRHLSDLDLLKGGTYDRLSLTAAPMSRAQSAVAGAYCGRPAGR
jgi:hypothetical protein